MKRRLNPFEPSKSKELPAHNKDLLEYLQAGHTVNFVTARKMLGITQLDKRIQEINKFTTVYRKAIRISNIQCYEYSLKPCE
jgi:glycyl-tRNA synthetase alpha subunit